MMSPAIIIWALGIPLGVLVAVGVIMTFTRLLFKAGEKEENESE
jgi:hypothetical protein